MSTRITGKVRFGYAVGHIFNDLSNAVWLSYTLLFFVHVVQFEPQVSGYLMLLGQLIDAICTPGIGYISDSYNLIFFSRFGKRKSWYFLVMIVGGLTSLIFFFSVQEAKLDKEQKTLVMMKTKKTIADILRQWQLYQIGCFYMCTRIYCSMMQCMVPLYILNSLKMDLLNIALVPLTMYTASLIASLLTGPLNERFGRKITFSFGAVLAGIASIWIEFHSKPAAFKTVYIFSVAVLFGSANSVMLVTALAATTDLVGSDTENGAFIFGIMTFLDKASCGILICIIQALYNKDKKYYQTALAISCGFSSFLAAVVVIAFPMEIEQDTKAKKERPSERPTFHT